MARLASQSAREGEDYLPAKESHRLSLETLPRRQGGSGPSLNPLSPCLALMQVLPRDPAPTGAAHGRPRPRGPLTTLTLPTVWVRLTAGHPQPRRPREPPGAWPRRFPVSPPGPCPLTGVGTPALATNPDGQAKARIRAAACVHCGRIPLAPACSTLWTSGRGPPTPCSSRALGGVSSLRMVRSVWGSSSQVDRPRGQTAFSLLFPRASPSSVSP